MSPSQADLDREFLDCITTDLAAGDWYGAYATSKGWIGSGGGAGRLDPWIGYVASGLLHGQPRTAIHPIDLALGTWLPRSADRSIMFWVRSRVLRLRLNDPRIAIADLADATAGIPSWLRPELTADVASCEAEAAVSRKRKPSVRPPPAFAASDFGTETLALRTAPLPPDGERPALWDLVRPLLDPA